MSDNKPCATHHWVMQRVSGIALLILTAWFLACFRSIATPDYTALVLWLQDPVVSIALMLFTIASFYHGWLGMQVVIDDYVHNKACHFVLMLAVRFALITGAVTCLYTIFSIAAGITFGG